MNTFTKRHDQTRDRTKDARALHRSKPRPGWKSLGRLKPLRLKRPLTENKRRFLGRRAADVTSLYSLTGQWKRTAASAPAGDHEVKHNKKATLGQVHLIPSAAAPHLSVEPKRAANEMSVSFLSHESIQLGASSDKAVAHVQRRTLC